MMENNYVVSLKDVSVFQEDNLILSDVNLEIKKGEFIYLIGKVGSGKTSLIKTLNAEIPLIQGEGEIVGIGLKKIKRKKIPYLRRKIGVVFQDFQLLNDRNIYSNLKFVLSATGWKNKKEIDQRINEVLEKVDLKEKILKMPNELSGGEKQRIVIARALLNDPDIILADEPTGNLDPDSSDIIMEQLTKISENGRAVLIATHNYTLLKKYPGKTLKCENHKLKEVKPEQDAIDIDALDD